MSFLVIMTLPGRSINYSNTQSFHRPYRMTPHARLRDQLTQGQRPFYRDMIHWQVVLIIAYLFTDWRRYAYQLYNVYGCRQRHHSFHLVLAYIRSDTEPGNPGTTCQWNWCRDRQGMFWRLVYALYIRGLLKITLKSTVTWELLFSIKFGVNVHWLSIHILSELLLNPLQALSDMFTLV